MTDDVEESQQPPEAMSAEEAGFYPPYVLTAAQRDRWDACRAVAVAVSEQNEDSGVADNTFVWPTMRALYRSDIPTGSRGDARGGAVDS